VQKGNGHAAPIESIYSDSFSNPPSAALRAALDQVVATAAPVELPPDGEGRRVVAMPAAVKVETAIIRDKAERELLFASTPRRGLPPVDWRCVGRWDLKPVGSLPYWQVRDFVLEFSVAHLFALERAFGRDGFDYVDDHTRRKYVAEPVACERVDVHSRRGTGCWIRYRGLWLAAGSLPRRLMTAEQAAATNTPGAKPNHPNLPIV
jgi:hypothetical protein